MEICRKGNIYRKAKHGILIKGEMKLPFFKSAPFSVHMLTSLRPGLYGHLTDSRNDPVNVNPDKLMKEFWLGQKIRNDFTNHLAALERWKLG